MLAVYKLYQLYHPLHQILGLEMTTKALKQWRATLFCAAEPLLTDHHMKNVLVCFDYLGLHVDDRVFSLGIPVLTNIPAAIVL